MGNQAVGGQRLRKILAAHCPGVFGFARVDNVVVADDAVVSGVGGLCGLQAECAEQGKEEVFFHNAFF